MVISIHMLAQNFMNLLWMVLENIMQESFQMYINNISRYSQLLYKHLKKGEITLMQC